MKLSYKVCVTREINSDDGNRCTLSNASNEHQIKVIPK